MSQNGALGEQYAADWLQGRGYRIVERNFHTRFGEIDIIAEKGEVIAFVEVKTRAANALARPCEWVTASKQRKLIISAEIYLSRRKCSLQPRFDVFEIVTADKNRFDVIEAQLIENAFGI